MSLGGFLLDVGRFLLDASREANERYVEEKEREVRRNGGFESEEDYNKYEYQRRIYDKRVENTYKDYNSTLDKLDSLRDKRDDIIYKLENDDLTVEERDYYRMTLKELDEKIIHTEDKMSKLTDDVVKYEKKNNDY